MPTPTPACLGRRAPRRRSPPRRPRSPSTQPHKGAHASPPRRTSTARRLDPSAQGFSRLPARGPTDHPARHPNTGDRYSAHPGASLHAHQDSHRTACSRPRRPPGALRPAWDTRSIPPAARTTTPRHECPRAAPAAPRSANPQPREIHRPAAGAATHNDRPANGQPIRFQTCGPPGQLMGWWVTVTSSRPRSRRPRPATSDGPGTATSPPRGGYRHDRGTSAAVTQSGCGPEFRSGQISESARAYRMRNACRSASAA